MAIDEDTGLQLRSLVKASGELELSLARIPIPAPAVDEVLVRIEATPLNPSDIGLLLGSADLSTARLSGTAQAPVLTATVPPEAMPGVAGRIGQSLPVGNEGAGLVVAAGASAAAQALIGKTVATFGGAMYAQHRCVRAEDAHVLPPGVTAAEGAACFVNPLTVLGMVGTMRDEGHKGLVHTAAASNLGQMLVKLCLEEGAPLVNIVRSPAQAKLLRDLGAAHVVESGAPDFMEALTEALAETDATLAFDAIGGGKIVSQILAAMEAAVVKKTGRYSRYGSAAHKQVYIYGALDPGPTELARDFGMTWGLGGWLLPPYLKKIGWDAAQALRRRVTQTLKTTFASHYTRTISLAEALQPEVIALYDRRATGEKYLINPQKGLGG
jgi:NADPH2:quinone reductase